MMKNNGTYVLAVLLVHMSIESSTMVLSQYLSTIGRLRKEKGYSFMHPSVQCSDTYFPKKEPLSPEPGDEFIHKKFRDLEPKESGKPKESVKTVVAAALSARGTCALGYNALDGNEIRTRTARGIEESYAMYPGVPIFMTAFWDENIIIMGTKGLIRYWDCTKNVFYDYSLIVCVPEAIAVHEKGSYAVISATSLEQGHRFYFFKPAESSKITVWPLLRHEKDRIEGTCVTSLAPHPTKSSFAVATADGKIRLWDIARNEKREEIVAPQNSMNSGGRQKITALLFYNCYVAGASSRGNILWWDDRSGEVAHYRVDCHKNTITSFKCLDDNLYASGSVDATVKLWDVRNIKGPLKTMIHGFPVAALSKLNKGRVLASCSKNGIVKHWDF